MMWILVVGGIVAFVMIVCGCVLCLRRPVRDEWSEYTTSFRDYVERKRKTMCQGGLHCDLSIRSLLCAFIVERRGTSPFAGDTTRQLLRKFMLENGLSEYS